MRADVIIIGAGHNGLVAASYLANAGLDVIMIEMRSTVGGLVQTEELFPGFRGNAVTNSAHSIEPQIIADMKLGSYGLRYESVEPSSLTLFSGGRRVVSWQDAAKVQAEIEHMAPGDSQGYYRLLTDLSRLGEVLNVSFFEPPPAFGEIASRAKTIQQQKLFAQVMFGSATDLVSTYMTSDEMQASVGSIPIIGTMMGPGDAGSAYFLAHRAIYKGARKQASPKSVSTEATAAPWTKSVPFGGMGAITQAMEQSVRAAGVQIRVDSRVESITSGTEGVQGVVLDSGEAIEASLVVSNANPITTLLQMVTEEALSESFRAELKEVPMKGSLAKVYLALDGTPQFASARDNTENERFLRAGFRTAPLLSTLDRGAGIARNGGWHEEPTIYGVFPSAVDPSLVPEGKHLLSLSVSGAPYSIKGGWTARRSEWIDHVIETLSEHILNLRDIIIDARARTPADLEREFGLLGGHPSHGDMTSQRLFGWGPVPGFRDARTPVRGLYLCSVGTWPANFCSGIPGRNAAAQVLDDLALAQQNELRTQRPQETLSESASPWNIGPQ